MVRCALVKDADVLKYASNILRDDPELVSIAVKDCGRLLQACAQIVAMAVQLLLPVLHPCSYAVAINWSENSCFFVI